MEQITYRKTLDVHKNGSQFLLQGFETADNLSRVIEISLMASGDAIDFPLERIIAMMYVTTPSATEPSINECIIKDNKVVYNVLPIVEEGITTMQLKLIETTPEGATSVLASPKFTVEVTKSNVDDESVVQTTTFTALEEAMAKAKTVYDERFLRMELSSDCIFRAYYADGTVYETDVLKKLFLNGNVELSKSYAMGDTGVRAGEDTDNSKYYSNVSKSESLNAKSIMENSKEILDEVRLHGVYTVFTVDFESGTVEYVSPSFKFKVNKETGYLETEGQSYTFEDEIGRVVIEWLEERDIEFSKLQMHGLRIEDLEEVTADHSERLETLETTPRPIELGGTGATTEEELREITSNLLYEKINYIGAGVEGACSPVTITFDKAPKYLMLCDLTDGYNVIFPYGQTLVRFLTYDKTSTAGNGGYNIDLTYDGHSITFSGGRTYYENNATSYYKPYSVFNTPSYEYCMVGIF